MGPFNNPTKSPSIAEDPVSQHDRFVDLTKTRSGSIRSPLVFIDRQKGGVYRRWDLTKNYAEDNCTNTENFWTAHSSRGRQFRPGDGWLSINYFEVVGNPAAVPFVRAIKIRPSTTLIGL
jgi:hypothetical protein